MPPFKLLVVAGEASGDLHGAAAVRAVRALRPDAEVFGMGGAELREAGAEISFDAAEVAVMGFSEVVSKVPRIFGFLRGLERAAAERKPDAALLIDLPDFNLRLARRLRRLGVPVFLYVSPTVWAWREGRVKLLARDVTEVLCIYPFEEGFLRERGVNARYVGNPLLDSETAPPLATRKVLHPLRLALLPGSRAAEVRQLLGPMLAAVKLLAAKHPGLELGIPVPPTIARATLETTLAGAGLTAWLAPNGTQEVLDWADVVLTKSGTATLEACLRERPAVVVYRVAAVSAFIARRLIKVKHAALPNLLAGRELVPELIQENLTPERMAAALEDVLRRRDEIVAGYREVRAKLGGPGAAARVAERVAGLDVGLVEGSKRE